MTALGVFNNNLRNLLDMAKVETNYRYGRPEHLHYSVRYNNTLNEKNVFPSSVIFRFENKDKDINVEIYFEEIAFCYDEAMYTLLRVADELMYKSTGLEKGVVTCDNDIPGSGGKEHRAQHSRTKA